MNEFRTANDLLNSFKYANFTIDEEKDLAEISQFDDSNMGGDQHSPTANTTNDSLASTASSAGQKLFSFGQKWDILFLYPLKLGNFKSLKIPNNIFLILHLESPLKFFQSLW